MGVKSEEEIRSALLEGRLASPAGRLGIPTRRRRFVASPEVCLKYDSACSPIAMSPGGGRSDGLGGVADDLQEETILSKDGLERKCEDSSGKREKVNEGLYNLVYEWLEDSNFSQLFGGINESSNVETRNIDEDEVELNERINCDDEDDENDEDYEYNSSDDCEEFIESDLEINEDDELFDSNMDPSVEFEGTTAKEKEKIAIGRYSEIDCMNSSAEASIEGSEEERITKWPVFNPRSKSGRIL